MIKLYTHRHTQKQNIQTHVHRHNDNMHTTHTYTCELSRKHTVGYTLLLLAIKLR